MQFITGQAMLFTLGRSDGVEQGWFSMWLRMMGPDGWFHGWLKAKDQYTGMPYTLRWPCVKGAGGLPLYANCHGPVR